MKNLRDFMVWFLPFTVFTIEIGWIKIGGIQFDWISQPFFVLTFIYFFSKKQIRIDKYEFYLFIFLLLQGLFNIFLNPLSTMGFLREFLPIIIIYFTCKTILIKCNIIVIFQKYIQFAYFAALIGIFQFMLKLFFGINFLTDLSGLFVDSVSFEPSHYVLIVLPAAVYLFEKKDFSLKFFIIVLTLILTFKITAILSVVIYLIFRNLNKLKIFILFTPVLFYTLYLIILQFPDFTDRYLNFVTYFKTNDLSTISNLTVFSFASNLEVAIHNLKQTFGMGIGLGGHESIYYSYFGSNASEFWVKGINAASAHSISIRIISEIGVVGIILFITFFIKVLKMPNSEYKIIALACLSHFIAKSIKLGGYFDYGTIFFFTMIILTLKINKLLTKNQNRQGVIIIDNNTPNHKNDFKNQ